jgi:putative DNA primase/helicase
MNAPPTAEQQFARALAEHRLQPTGIVADGQLHRFDGPDEKHGKRSAWYVLYGDGDLPAGAFGDWRSGLSWTWRSKLGHSLTHAEREITHQRTTQARTEAAAVRAMLANDARKKCVELWGIGGPVRADHPYVQSKGIKPFGAKQLRNALLIPLRDAGGELRNLQFIQPDGGKRFKADGVVSGCCCLIGMASEPEALLLICEGWATACSLHSATGHPVAAAMSAGNLVDVANAWRAKLPHARIVLAADDDLGTDGNPGITKATAAARAIGGLLAIPEFGRGRPTGATDFNDLAAFAGLEAVSACVDAAASPEALVAMPIADRMAPGSAKAPSRPSVLLSRASDITPEPIRWLWPGWLPASKLTLLAGSPGTGKTTLALTLAACVTRAGSWPDGTKSTQPGDVLMWSGEDDPADTLVPRLAAAGADLRRVHFVRSVIDGNGEIQPFDPSRDIPLLGERLAEMGGARLLIIDPIVSAVSGDAHRANDVRRNLQALIDMAGTFQCAVLGISHFAKSTKGNAPSERVIGSQAFVALARMVLVTAKDEAAERRILARAKSNIAPDDGGVSYSLEQVETNGIEASRIVWGAMIVGTARDILGDIEQDDEEKTGQDDAHEFLVSILADGPLRTKEIKLDADGAGYNWKMMQRAASRLGVEKRKLGMKEGWEWALSKETRHEEDTKSPALRTKSPSVIHVPFGSGKGLRAAGLPDFAKGDTAEGVESSGTSLAVAARDEPC